MIKALFFDIDGTLVSFQTHTIPTSAVRAIAAAKAGGLKIFIATGRPEVLINSLAPLQELHLIDGYVTMNGAYCYVGQEVIYKNSIPSADVQAVINYCTQLDIPCIVVGEKDICVCNSNNQVKQIFNIYLKTTHIPEKKPQEVLAGNAVYQLTMFITKEQESEIRPSLPHCEIERWHPAFADITAIGNNKQRGVDEICRHFGIKAEEAMAFGDGGNDISMLRHVGTGIAMGDASAEVKASADYVTDTVEEDGIANALKHFKLI